MAWGWIGWVGAGIALLVCAGLWWSGRQRLLQRAIHSDKCPRCGQDKWHRVHRTVPDHVFGAGLKVRRFRCANETCQWEGLRKRANG